MVAADNDILLKLAVTVQLHFTIPPWYIYSPVTMIFELL